MRLGGSRLLAAPIRKGATLVMGAAALTVCAPAWAAAPSFDVPATSAQQALHVEVAPGALHLTTCARAPCTTGTASSLEIPDPFGSSSSRATLRVLSIGAHRSIALVEIHDDGTGQSWAALLGAAPTGAAVVIFDGLAHVGEAVGSSEPSVIGITQVGAVEQVLVGSEEPSFDLCGRPAMLGPKLVDPKDLGLKPVLYQRLLKKDRDAAPILEATAHEGTAPLGQVLSVRGATSAIGSPANLLDGNLDTSWSEGRGDDGRGEFVAFNAPAAVGLTGLVFDVRPTTRTVSNGAAPLSAFVATDHELFLVHFPTDGWKAAGSSFDVSFPTTVHTSCLAVVLEESYTGDDSSQAVVTLSEVQARTELDGVTDLAGLAKMLATGDDRAHAARDILMGAGPAGLAALRPEYDGLPEAGRLLALDVVDQAPCEEGATFYARSLASKNKAEHEHALEHLKRCGKGATEALVQAVTDEKSPSRVEAASLLASASPEQTLKVLTRAPASTPAVHKAFLQALKQAARDPRTEGTLATLFIDDTLSPEATLTLLRVAETRVSSGPLVEPATRALQRLMPTVTSFADRYLLLEPAARLARVGAPGAVEFLRHALLDPDAHLRGRAGALSLLVSPLRAPALALLGDAEPRVREAVALAAAEVSDSALTRPLLGLLSDEWTFVRAAAYRALAMAPPDGTVDRTLLEHLGEERVQYAKLELVRALTHRQALVALPALRALVQDKKESIDVRIAAIRALGELCDQTSLDALTQLAHEGETPMSEEDAQSLGRAAMVALHRLNPLDLKARMGTMTTGPGHALQLDLSGQPRCR